MSTPTPPFPKQDMDWPGQESKMDPAPDFGYDSYKGTGKLQDKIALITGADSGIGRAVALAYAREGAHVAIAYYNEHDDAKETQRVVEEAGREAILLPGDLVDDEMCKKLIDETLQKWGKIDILVNNAAYQHDAVGEFTDISRERLERAFNTNILAMFRLSQLAYPHMKKQGSGAIINVGSIQAYKPSPAILDYASTKGAIVAFTKGLAQAAIKDGIRVNCVAPGPVWTPLVVQSFPEEKVIA
jgi:NAD(P)-dependent dehydrogenase (short-subunit alcohol dehydrogenase family)